MRQCHVLGNEITNVTAHYNHSWSNIECSYSELTPERPFHN